MTLHSWHTRWARGLAVTLFLVASGLSLPACDDTLMTLMTASDPKSDFSQGIRAFNRNLASLGTALKEQRLSEVDGLLGQVMEAWMALSNRFSTSPPDEARGDPNWIRKMQGAAERIGEIRRSLKAGETLQAHNQVLALSNHLGTFFESVRMSESYRVFLRMSEHFFQLEQLSAADDVDAMRPVVASLTVFLAGLKPRLATETQAPFQIALGSLLALDTGLAPPGTPTPAVRTILIQSAKDDFLSLRSRILMMEWFPALPNQGGPK